jgi:hypothetical protein
LLEVQAPTSRTLFFALLDVACQLLKFIYRIVAIDITELSGHVGSVKPLKELPMRFVFLAAILPLAGCVIPPSVVSGYNGSSVTIQRPGLPPASGPGQEEIDLAKKTCGGNATIASNRMVADSRTEHLFICR